jgi:homogentisate phytyltransferase/homogentisate geranylgeranyltransferase
LKASKARLGLKLFSISSIKEVASASATAIKTLWSFTRPHTIVGSAISVIALFLFATPPEFWLTKSFIMSIIESAVPALLMNIYITGLNQVTDVEIDKINKPYLPIAAGDLSLRQGITIIIASLIGSLIMVWNAAWPLKSTLIGSAILGTIYSLPPFRLKRYPQLAALCILIVRGSIVNLGFYFQAKCKLIGSDYFYSFFNACKAYPEAVLLTTFFAIFGLVIAIMKDVPDIKGDQLFDIPSFSVQLGSKKMFNIAKTILLGLLISSALSSLVMLGLQYNTISNITKGCRVALSLILLAISADLGRKAMKVDTDNSKQIFDYYMYVWVIFYACYLLLPLAR